MNDRGKPLTADQQLWLLCHELDIEMDGVEVPASAAAILNAIRRLVTEKFDAEE